MTLQAHRRVWNPRESATFRKTKETWGGFSNMAAGFPLTVGAIRVRTSEALYQAMRFPEHPDIQRHVLDQRSPMAAKMVTKPFRETHGLDQWEALRVDVMRWALQVKLICNRESFGSLLRRSGDRPIVEVSARDGFWGAVPQGDSLVGLNTLGLLLMELRDTMDQLTSARLRVSDLKLLSEPVPEISSPTSDSRPEGGVQTTLDLFRPLDDDPSN